MYFSVLKFYWVSESSGKVTKHGSLGNMPRDFDSVGLGWGLSIYISNEFPDNADAGGQGTTFWEQLKYALLRIMVMGGQQVTV